MISTEHTQSLTDFRAKASETLDRLNSHADHAEIITVNGKAKAVLLSPTAYDELAKDALLTRDVAVMRKAMKELDEGKGRPVDEVFAELRTKLLTAKAAGHERMPA